MRSIISATVVLGAAFAGLASVPARADMQNGHEKAKQVCAACHGEAGDKPLQPDYPVLAGQYRDYLDKALRDYKAGVRKNALMNGQAQNLTRQDMRDLAEWFSSQPSPLYVKR
ncbi:MAG: cytochrome c [Burkholderiales bacterium]|nr:cytochrome c [Burkholderiales bacterium]